MIGGFLYEGFTEYHSMMYRNIERYRKIVKKTLVFYHAKC